MFGLGKKTKIDTNSVKIDELLNRGVDEVIDKENLKKRLLSGKQLRIKLGIDPTSPNLHLGRAVPLMKMRDFQNLGHKVVLIVGDATGVIGDTSDKDSERPMLSAEKIAENKRKYFDQISKLIDVSKAELHHNSKWLNKLDFKEIGKLAEIFSVNQFIQRDNIRRRIDEGKRISLREVLYPLMQGYDSVVVKSDVELGGTDQRFNLLAGRTIQESSKQRPQDILMTPLIEGTDGRKMSSSWGNTINFSDKPDQMFGAIMSIRDELIVKYMTLLTRISLEKIEEYEQKIKNGDNPRDIKIILGKEIVKIFHSEREAEKAEENFIKTFSKKEAPDNVEEVKVTSGTLLSDVLLQKGIISSKGEFRRLVEGGGITNIDTGEKVDDINFKIEETAVYKIGKKRFIKGIIRLS